MSFKAIESQNPQEDKQWLSYWVCFAFLTIFDGVLSKILFFIPFYYVIKLGFILYLQSEKYRGATFVYEKVLQPALNKYEPTIDKDLNNIKNQAYDRFKKY